MLLSGPWVVWAGREAASVEGSWLLLLLLACVAGVGVAGCVLV